MAVTLSSAGREHLAGRQTLAERQIAIADAKLIPPECAGRLRSGRAKVGSFNGRPSGHLPSGSSVQVQVEAALKIAPANCAYLGILQLTWRLIALSDCPLTGWLAG